jgi:hypothetical protein
VKLTANGWDAVLTCCSYVAAPTTAVEQALTAELTRLKILGERSVLPDRDAVGSFLAPLTSIWLRGALVSVGERWVCWLENRPYGDGWTTMAMALSRRLGARAVTACSDRSHRGAQFFLYESGAEVRSVQCFPDGNEWFFHQDGVLQPFEDLRRYGRRRKEDRLDFSMLVSYVAAAGFQYPLPAEKSWGGVGFVRDQTRLRVVPDVLPDYHEEA